MKRTLKILIYICCAQFASCQKIEEKSYELIAEAVDEEGMPLEGISVMTGRLELEENSPVPMVNPVTTVPMQTDGNGKTVIRFRSAPEASGNVTFFNDAYYSTRQRVEWARPDGFDGKTRKANVKAVIKPIRKPIPMYAYDNSGAMDKIAMIPRLGKEYGYDLQLAEPLPPLGKGKVADFTFIVNGQHHGNSVYDLKLDVRFRNLNDGVLEFITPQRSAVTEPIQTGSHLISEYVAPVGGYQSKITRTLKRDGIETARNSNVDFHRNFYFRTRTVTDADGKIVSAHYGKIYGDFQFDAANKDWGYLATLALVTTYFNPTPNDRNVEFDPKRNLLPGGNVMRP